MNAKKESRIRRSRRSRVKMRELGVDRLCVNRTPRHIYAQIIVANGDSAKAQVLEITDCLTAKIQICNTPKFHISSGYPINLYDHHEVHKKL